MIIKILSRVEKTVMKYSALLPVSNGGFTTVGGLGTVGAMGGF